jgi:hypothetical protein
MFKTLKPAIALQSTSSSIPTGQWSEPGTSLRMKADLTASFRLSLTKK